MTETNSEGRFLSFDDPTLSESGRAQCERLRADLQRFEFARCYVSPMQRCLQTRDIVAPGIPFTIQEALREVHFGAWEGRTVEWLERNEPDALARRRRDPVTFRPPGGESFEDVAQRVATLVENIRSGPPMLVIGHRGTLGVLERLLRGLPLDSRDVRPLEPAEFVVIG